MTVGEWPISFYEPLPDELLVRAVRPMLSLPRPRRKKEVLHPNSERIERNLWIAWVQQEIAATTEERDPWNDERWDDWGKHPEELSFESWRREFRAAKL